MGDMINLNKARKDRARRDKDRKAEENRTAFGRTKAQKTADAAARKKREAELDGARRDSPDENDA